MATDDNVKAIIFPSIELSESDIPERLLMIRVHPEQKYRVSYVGGRMCPFKRRSLFDHENERID